MQLHHHVLPSGRQVGLVLLAAATSVLAACTAPKIPDPAPTKEEVPFLGQQLTQQEITRLRQQVEGQRATLRLGWENDQRACYQRFWVDACLKQERRTFLAQDLVLQKQGVELNRQDRRLKEIDRQLRLADKAREAAAQSAPAPQAARPGLPSWAADAPQQPVSVIPKPATPSP